MATNEERQQILQMIADKQITADQGAELLAALNDDADQTALIDGNDVSLPSMDRPQIDLPSSRNLWQVPMWIGVGILILGAAIFTPAYQGGGAAAWPLIVCGWPMFALGLLMIVAASYARRGPWAHVRIMHANRYRHDINISVPLNLCVAILKIVTPFVPRLKRTGIDDVLISLQNSVTPEQPLYIDVNEDENGEHIQVVVG